MSVNSARSASGPRLPFWEAARTCVGLPARAAFELRAGHVLLAFALYAFAYALVDLIALGAAPMPAMDGVMALLARCAAMTAAMTAIAVLLGLDRRICTVLTLAAAGLALGAVLGGAWRGLSPNLVLGPVLAHILWLVLTYTPVALGLMGWSARAGAGIAAGLLLSLSAILPVLYMTGFLAPAPLLEPRPDMSAPRVRAADPEVIYPMQPALLAEQFAALRPQTPGKVDLYALLGAGHPSQQIFQREVAALSGLLAQRFGTAGRTIRLGPTAAEPAARALLNRTNIAASLAGLAARMDVTEDVALIYLTSHGNRNQISTTLGGLSIYSVTARELARALEASGIENAVIVVSACYSGSFVDELEGPGRLVLTASAAERNSFGCSDVNEFTDWGAAFMAGLQETGTFLGAAEAARRTVDARERAERLTPSEPQISVGAGILQVLSGRAASHTPLAE